MKPSLAVALASIAASLVGDVLGLAAILALAEPGSYKGI